MSHVTQTWLKSETSYIYIGPYFVADMQVNQVLSTLMDKHPPEDLSSTGTGIDVASVVSGPLDPGPRLLGATSKCFLCSGGEHVGQLFFSLKCYRQDRNMSWPSALATQDSFNIHIFCGWRLQETRPQNLCVRLMTNNSDPVVYASDRGPHPVWLLWPVKV